MRSRSWVIVVALGVALDGAVAGCDREVAGGRADGPQIFAEVCARCHGPRGVPAAAMVAQLGVKDLTSVRVQRELGAAGIARQIRRGSENRRMPSFEGALGDAQIDAVVRHVQTLAPPSR